MSQKESEWEKELSEQWNKGSQQIEQYQEIIRKALSNREKEIAEEVQKMADETGPKSVRMSAYQDVLQLLRH